MQNARSGNRRENNVRRWLDALGKRYKHVALCVYEASDDGSVQELVQLAKLPAGASDVIAVQLVELLQDHASERGRAVKGTLVAYAADGEELARKAVQGRKERNPNSDELDAPEDLDGTVRGNISQYQRHREAEMRTNLMERAELRLAYDRIIGQQQQLIERLAERLDDAQAREDAARALARAIEDEMSEQAAEQGEDDGQAAALALQVGGKLLMRLMGDNPRPKPPKAPEPPSGPAES